MREFDPHFEVAAYSGVIVRHSDFSMRYRMLVCDLPRRFHAQPRAERILAMARPPRLTGTRWDAGLAEHLEPARMAVGESARLPLGQSGAIAVSDWSGRGPARNGDRRAAGESDREPDRPLILEAFERLDRKLRERDLRAVVHLARSAPLVLDGSRTRDVDTLRIEAAGRRSLPPRCGRPPRRSASPGTGSTRTYRWCPGCRRGLTAPNGRSTRAGA